MTNIDSDLQKRFSTVFTEKHWGGVSPSGPGSDPHNPMALRAVEGLKAVIPKFSIASIADIPCGDFHFLKDVTDAFPAVRYEGFDIVEPIIAKNKSLHPAKTFRVFDIVSAVPPAFDLIFCKELLIHLRNEDALKALRNMKASGSAFLMASNSFGIDNEELEHAIGGMARPIDLMKPPFSIGAPAWNNALYGLWDLRRYAL